MAHSVLQRNSLFLFVFLGGSLAWQYSGCSLLGPEWLLVALSGVSKPGLLTCKAYKLAFWHPPPRPPPKKNKGLNTGECSDVSKGRLPCLYLLQNFTHPLLFHWVFVAYHLQALGPNPRVLKTCEACTLPLSYLSSHLATLCPPKLNMLSLISVYNTSKIVSFFQAPNLLCWFSIIDFIVAMKCFENFLWTLVIGKKNTHATSWKIFIKSITKTSHKDGSRKLVYSLLNSDNIKIFDFCSLTTKISVFFLYQNVLVNIVTFM